MDLTGSFKRITSRLRKLAGRGLKAARVQVRLLQWEVIGNFRRTITCSSEQGVFTVRLTGGESIGKSLFSTGQFELDLMSRAMTFLRSIEKCPPRGEGTILDIGANIGVISIGMLHTGEVANAVAIEPEPQNFSLLQHNVKQNGLDAKVTCLPYAVSDQAGEVSFEVSDSNFGDHRVRVDMRGHAGRGDERFNESRRRAINVKRERLDILVSGLSESLSQNVAAIWVDVQGHEGYVFLGARELLARGIPVVSEIWPYGIRRSGMSQEQFCSIAASLWPSYWVMRRGRFVRYPIEILGTFFDELGPKDWDNVIFTK